MNRIVTPVSEAHQESKVLDSEQVRMTRAIVSSAMLMKTTNYA